MLLTLEKIRLNTTPDEVSSLASLLRGLGLSNSSEHTQGAGEKRLIRRRSSRLSCILRMKQNYALEEANKLKRAETSQCLWGERKNSQSRRENLSEINYNTNYRRHRLSFDQVEEGNKVRVNDKNMDERIMFIAKFDSTNQVWPDRFNY